MKHMSQICKNKLCKFCPVPKKMTVDISDEDIDNDVDGSVCLFEKNT
jgi:hypothetical protein